MMTNKAIYIQAGIGPTLHYVLLYSYAQKSSAVRISPTHCSDASP